MWQWAHTPYMAPLVKSTRSSLDVHAISCFAAGWDEMGWVLAAKNWMGSCLALHVFVRVHQCMSICTYVERIAALCRGCYAMLWSWGSCLPSQTCPRCKLRSHSRSCQHLPSECPQSSAVRPSLLCLA
jgi:hypothetical protein